MAARLPKLDVFLIDVLKVNAGPAVLVLKWDALACMHGSKYYIYIYIYMYLHVHAYNYLGMPIYHLHVAGKQDCKREYTSLLVH